MPELNISSPAWKCYVRREYLFNCIVEKDRELWTPVLVIGISSVPGRALGFHVLTEDGGLFWRLPITALASKPTEVDHPLEHAQLWDCFTPFASCIIFDYLDRMRCRVRVGKEHLEGTYLMTIDWYGLGSNAEYVDDVGHKCAHIIELDDGNYVAQPNNRIVWLDKAWVSEPMKPGENPGYKTNTQIWKCERGLEQ